MEDHSVRRSGLEHAVDDRAVKVQVRIERRAEAVDEGDRAETRGGAQTRAVRAQAGLHRAQERTQSGTLQVGIALPAIAQALGHRKHPLPQRQRGQDVIDEMRRRRHHAPRVGTPVPHAPAPTRRRARRGIGRARSRGAPGRSDRARSGSGGAADSAPLRTPRSCIRSPCPPPLRRVAASGIRVGGTT